jgi:hypothetical protein
MKFRAHRDAIIERAGGSGSAELSHNLAWVPKRVWTLGDRMYGNSVREVKSLWDGVYVALDITVKLSSCRIDCGEGGQPAFAGILAD